MIKKILTILLLLPFTLSGQKSIPVNVSLFSEMTAIPFTRFIVTPVHPGIQAGTEFNYTVKNHGRLFQTANLSYFYHSDLCQGIGITTELGYEYRSGCGLALGSLLGLGYLHTFATAKEFAFNDGKYERRTDFGNARLAPSLSLDLGYYFRKSDDTSPKAFLRYQVLAEYPYSPGFIPVMTHSNLHAGVKVFIHPKIKNNE